MFHRHKPNLDLSGLNEHFQKENRLTYGINWGTNDSISPDDRTDENLPSEEITEDDCFPSLVPGNQSRRAILENKQLKTRYPRQPDTSSPPLARRPSFAEQQQKVTIYLNKKLVRQMAQ